MSLHFTHTCMICLNFCIDELYVLPEKMTGDCFTSARRYRMDLCLEDIKQGAQVNCPLAAFLVKEIDNNGHLLEGGDLLEGEDLQTPMLWVEAGLSESLIPCCFGAFGFWNPKSECYEPSALPNGFELNMWLYISNEQKQNLTAEQANELSLLQTYLPLTKRIDGIAQEEFRQKLNHCQKHHEKCRINNKEFFPKRMIHIEEEDGRFSLRLRPRTSLDTAEPYAALSYCWGGDQPGKATKSRVEAYSRVIPWENIGMTIQDAVEVAHNLGLSYLWVDAYCIIQDDQDDLDEQIPQMPDIYNQAAVTIVANRAQACADGFLQYPELESMIDFITPIKLRLSRFPGDLEVSGYCLKHEYYTVSPTDTRGWCYQEKWLSVRLLEFERREVSFSCLSDWSWRRRFMVDSYENDSGDTDVAALWRTSVGQFTQCKLTRPEDRAIASSGLARMFSPRLQEAYYAGLWETSLPLDLLWRTLFWDIKPSQRLQDYQGPSWSWFSSIKAVHLPYGDERRNFECRIDLLNVETTLKSERNPYGSVRGGRITMKGRIRRARIVHPDVSRQARMEYDDIRDKSWRAEKLFEKIPKDVFGEYEKKDLILMDPGCSSIDCEADAEEVDGAPITLREPAIETGVEDTASISKNLHVGCAPEQSTLGAGRTQSIHSDDSSDSSDWIITLPAYGPDQSTPCLPFSQAYNLDRYGTILSGRIQPDALEAEFISGSSSERDYIEVELLEFGQYRNGDDRSGPIGLVLREVASTSSETLSRRKFSRLGTFRFEETYALLRPPAFDTSQWREIVRSQLDWFSDRDEEVIDII